jgi:hypothetical protein
MGRHLPAAVDLVGVEPPRVLGDGSSSISSSAQPRLTAVGRDRAAPVRPRRILARGGREREPYAAATPIAGAPRTTIVGSRPRPRRRFGIRPRPRRAAAPLVEEDDAIALEAEDPLRFEHRSGALWARATAQVPSSHDARYFDLLGGQRVDLDAHRRELQAGDLLVDRDRHGIDLVLELAACCTAYSVASAWFAKLMSITIAGCPRRPRC